MEYDPMNWYWWVNGQGPNRDYGQVLDPPTVVFSSVVQDYVPASDDTYLRWTAAGLSELGYDPTTQIDTEEHLAEVLLPYGVGPPTWDVLLAEKTALGIAITSLGTPALDTTFGLDTVTVNEVRAVATDYTNGLGLPGGGVTFEYPDLAGNPCVFTGDQTVALYKAMRDLIFNLDTQAAVMKAGGTPNWPDQTATIP